jgi:hypothetical protein
VDLIYDFHLFVIPAVNLCCSQSMADSLLWK